MLAPVNFGERSSKEVDHEVDTLQSHSKHYLDISVPPYALPSGEVGM